MGRGAKSWERSFIQQLVRASGRGEEAVLGSPGCSATRGAGSLTVLGGERRRKKGSRDRGPVRGARPPRGPSVPGSIARRLTVSARCADADAGARTGSGEAYTVPASPRGVVGAPGRSPGQQKSHTGQRLRPQAAGPSPERPAQDTAAATTAIPAGSRGPNQLEASAPYRGLQRRRRHFPQETDREQAPHSAPGEDWAARQAGSGTNLS